MKYFKIKTGFGKNDVIQIDETEVAQAIRAQINGGVAITKRGTISGSAILSIVPDWNKVMGWKSDYQLTGEDWDEIGEKKQNEYNQFLGAAKDVIEGRTEKPMFSNETKALAEKMKL